MIEPTNRFSSAPPLHHPPATPIQEPLAGRSVAVPLPAPVSEARLTVRANGDVTLSKPLVSAIPHLRGSGPVDLVPPMRRGGIWHLDTRATAPRRLPAAPGAVARFRIAPLSREHLLRPGVDPARGTVGTVGTVEVLSFRLGAEVTEQVCVVDEAGKRVCQQRGTGYFELVPIR